MSAVGTSKGILEIAKFAVYVSVPVGLTYAVATDSKTLQKLMGFSINIHRYQVLKMSCSNVESFQWSEDTVLDTQIYDGEASHDCYISGIWWYVDDIPGAPSQYEYPNMVMHISSISMSGFWPKEFSEPLDLASGMSMLSSLFSLLLTDLMTESDNGQFCSQSVAPFDPMWCTPLRALALLLQRNFGKGRGRWRGRKSVDLDDSMFKIVCEQASMIPTMKTVGSTSFLSNVHNGSTNCG